MERILEPEVMDGAAEADAYDRMDHGEPNRAFVERLVALGARGQMLDIGTGPGHIPPLVCERIADARVLGVDLSAHMLRHAERHRSASPHADRIAYRLCDAKALPFPDGSFDAVFSNTILHHIRDPRDLLREAWRVRAPGGALLIRDLFRPAAPERALALVEQYAGEADAEQRALFRASLHAALTPAELRALVLELGLEDVQVVVDSDRHVSVQTAARPAAAT